MSLPALVVCAVLLAGPATAATVFSVGDGDTLRVLDGGQKVTIRLACIDAPETSQKPYGAASRQQLQALAPIGTEVQLRIQTTDRYGRTVAEIIRNGQNVNLSMVRSGQAFAYRQYLRKCDAVAYLGAERAAEGSLLGVWAVHGGITRPWDWRHSRRSGGSSSSRPADAGNAGSMQPITAPSGYHYRCKEIGSFARAQELLHQGHTYLDRDGDGVACESLRRGRRGGLYHSSAVTGIGTSVSFRAPSLGSKVFKVASIAEAGSCANEGYCQLSCSSLAAITDCRDRRTDATISFCHWCQ